MTSAAETGPSFSLPWVCRVLNAVGEPAVHLRLPPMSLDEDVLIREARRTTGLTDLGDEAFREPLRALLWSLNHESEMSVLGRLAMHRELTLSLESRLHIQEALRLDPGIRDEVVEAPIFIVGLPRTGTTLLHNLLAQDPHSRAPLAWELRSPAPPPRPETHTTDPRITACRQRFERLHRIIPHVKQIHPMQADWPDECFYLLFTNFAALTYDAFASVPSYMAYLRTVDWTPHWQTHKLQLQILQRHFPRPRWILKAPEHICRLPSLFETYPDARLILTHRDPTQVVPSCCSLFEASRAVFSSQPDPSTMGRAWLDTWGPYVQNLATVRHDLPADRCVDLHFGPLMKDPVGEIHKAWDTFGLPFTAAFEAGIRSWLESNPRDKHGTHTYTLARYGLERGEVDAYFAAYREAFGIKQGG